MMLLRVRLILVLSIASTTVCAVGNVEIEGIASPHQEGHVVVHADEDQKLFEYCPDAAEDVKGNVVMTIDPPLNIKSNGTRSDKDDEDDGVVDAYTKTWIPGYPGSGSEMLITIIKGLTGLEASNTYHRGHCQSKETISCKTHYPVLKSKKEPWSEYMKDGSASSVPFSGNYFILLRNPAHSIPSYYNWLWENHQKGIQHHTTQAPIEDWREWRNAQFLSQIKKWVNIIRTWEESPLQLSLYLPFERLVNPTKGPALVQYMASEFALANSISIADDPTRLDIDMVPCLWKELVMDHPSKKRTSSYDPGFTTEQKEIMLRSLEDLMDWAIDLPADVTGTRLVDILDGYHNVISSGLVIDD